MQLWINEPASGIAAKAGVLLALAAAAGGVSLGSAQPLVAQCLVAISVLTLAGIAWRGLQHAHTVEKQSVGATPLVTSPSLTLDSEQVQDLPSIESFKDMQWELRERESRLQDMIDRQQDAILRLDEQGRLLFFNRSFDRMFGGGGDSGGSALAIGQVFRPAVIDGDLAAPAAADPWMRRRYVQLLETVQGPKWIAWEDHRIRVDGDRGYEIQRVGRDVTDERKAESELQDARHLAEAASRAKSRFLAVVSHEIRTPMNGVLGMTSLLLGTELTADQSTFARSIRQSAQTLLSLIDEILDFSKIEAGKLRLEALPMALVDVVQDVVELLAPRAHEKGLEIGWSIDPDVPVTLIGDANRLRQVLTNLVGNAIKFTLRGGVDIVVERSRNSTPLVDGGVGIVFAVRDTGIGLSTEAQSAIFAEFVQADSTTSRPFGGTGLGLAISRRLVEAMGGSITVSSAPDAGAEFRAEIVLQSAAGCQTLRDRWPGLPGRQRFLVAGGLELEQRAIIRTLQSLGHHPLRIETNEIADVIRRAQTNGEPVQAVLLDPRTAHELAPDLIALSSAAEAKQVRTIVMIEPGERGLLKELMAHGCHGYLVRPIRPQSLLMQLRRRQRGVQVEDARLADGAVVATSRSEFPVERDIGSGKFRSRILLAEDNDINALVGIRMLQSIGLDVTRVRNGRLAVEEVRRAWLAADGRRFELVLMDVQMPELDGLAATKEIQRLAVIDNVTAPPIVALTANAFAEDRQTCLDEGMNDFLAKPFERSHLEDMIEKWLATDDQAAPGGGAGLARPASSPGGAAELAEVAAR